MRVAFQGEPGAYSEAAALEHFGEGIETRPCHSFDEVFEAVDDGGCERGLVPIENSLGGSIHRNYDLLLAHEALEIVGEHYLRIVHCLIAHSGTRAAEIRRVFSHPQALAQCEATLRDLGDVELVSTHDTAGSVARIVAEAATDAAAIASRRAAEVHGMEVLREGIEDFEENYTRFLALARRGNGDAPNPADVAPADRTGDGPGDPTGGGDEPGAPAGAHVRAASVRPDVKTSIVFTTRDVPGALFKALSVFALRDIDLTKIESRPHKGRLWEYLFYLDFVGSAEDEPCRNALRHLAEISAFVRLLGSYPRGRLGPA